VTSINPTKYKQKAVYSKIFNSTSNLNATDEDQEEAKEFFSPKEKKKEKSFLK
jgi:hypothetical protein